MRASQYAIQQYSGCAWTPEKIDQVMAALGHSMFLTLILQQNMTGLTSLESRATLLQRFLEVLNTQHPSDERILKRTSIPV